MTSPSGMDLYKDSGVGRGHRTLTLGLRRYEKSTFLVLSIAGHGPELEGKFNTPDVTGLLGRMWKLLGPSEARSLGEALLAGADLMEADENA